MKDYLDGAIIQLKARARHLMGLVPRNLPRDVDTLVVLCRDRITSLQSRLDALVVNPEFASSEHQGLRLRRYRRALEDLDLVESVVVAALMRWNEHDQRMNRIVGQITREIRFPLPAPVATCMSPWRGYYHTYPSWNLVVLPLAEGQFLLHLPDLYHELAHSLLDADGDPRLDPFQNAFRSALVEVHRYLAEQMDKEQRRDGPRSFMHYLSTWLACWEDWLIELFCDLFAVYTVGPAFAWGHYHLCAGGGGAAPHDVPLAVPRSHPADAARMRAVLEGLRIAGRNQDARKIEQRWNALLTTLKSEETAEYRRCFPDWLLQRIAEIADTGAEQIGCLSPTEDAAGPVGRLLNDAWDRFWQDPPGFVEWEKTAVDRLDGLCFAS